MSATDLFAGFTTSPLAAPENLASVTPDDNADLAFVTRALMVTEAGDVEVVMLGGQQDVIPALQPGVMYPARVCRVLATGTTATGIKALW